jgi:hypothetical protein
MSGDWVEKTHLLGLSIPRHHTARLPSVGLYYETRLHYQGYKNRRSEHIVQGCNHSKNTGMLAYTQEELKFRLHVFHATQCPHEELC